MTWNHLTVNKSNLESYGLIGTPDQCKQAFYRLDLWRSEVGRPELLYNSKHIHLMGQNSSRSWII